MVSSPVGTMTGAIVGGLLALCLLAGAIAYRCRRMKSSNPPPVSVAAVDGNVATAQVAVKVAASNLLAAWDPTRIRRHRNSVQLLNDLAPVAVV
ncbi:hypothetical protein T492DRAFT_934546 [Pavlovales sp. CCMP2436]|nr:hypothetical protein T492DRAFT_934546 [Pavlovales sp. CCMP2436]